MTSCIVVGAVPPLLTVLRRDDAAAHPPPFNLARFTAYCRTSHVEENVDFWPAVEAFRAGVLAGGFAGFGEWAAGVDAVSARFLTAGAASEVNVPCRWAK